MLLRRSISLAACMLAGCLVLSGQPNRNAAWEFTADPKLPNVLIIGDSISMGYTPLVRKMLQSTANVMHPMRPDGKAPVNCFSTAEFPGGLVAHWP